MIAASLNAALGRAGLMLMLAASTFGALSVLYGQIDLLRERAARQTSEAAT